jgi:hypothetical protein
MLPFTALRQLTQLTVRVIQDPGFVWRLRQHDDPSHEAESAASDDSSDPPGDFYLRLSQVRGAVLAAYMNE